MQDNISYKGNASIPSWGNSPRYYLHISEESYLFIRDKFPEGWVLEPEDGDAFVKRVRLESNTGRKLLVFKLMKDTFPSVWTGDPKVIGDHYILGETSSDCHALFYWIIKERNKILDTLHTLDII